MSAPEAHARVPIVDAHVHLLPGRLAEKVRAFFAPIADHLRYPLDHEVVRRRLAEDGIDEAWTLPYAHKPGVAVGLNEAAADTASRPGPVRIVAGATVHPADADPAAVVRDAVERLGCRVLKLHCSVGDFLADDARLEPVWTYVEETGMPVVVHVGHGVDGRTHAHEVGPIDVVARRHPEAAIIIAHCANPDVDAALDLVERHPLVHADLTPVLTEPTRIPPARAAALAGKLLLGSDAPNTGVTAGECLAAVRALPLSDEQIAAICGGTARALLDRMAARTR